MKLASIDALSQTKVKRRTLVSFTLRSRTYGEKAAIISELEAQVWPLIESDQFKGQVYRFFALKNARGDHELIDSARSAMGRKRT